MKNTAIQGNQSGGDIGSQRIHQREQMDTRAKNIKRENENKESHYSVGGIEVKDIQEAKMPKQLVGVQCAHWANLVKYSLRCGWKGTLLKDLKKARDYLNWLIEDVEKNSAS